MAKPPLKSPTRPQSGKRDSGLFDAYLGCEKPLKRFLSRFFSRPEDIDDLAQEAFLRAFDAGRDKDIRSPKAYLYRVARNIALRDLSKKSRQLTDYLEDAGGDNALGLEASCEEELIAQQKLEQCCKAIADLPEQCRRVFLLRKIHAHSHKEIAQQLEISPRTVEKHITKGIDRFTQYMEQQDTTAVHSNPDGSTHKRPWS